MNGDFVLYLFDLIAKGYEIQFYESKSYAKAMKIKLIKEPYKVVHIVTKYDTENDLTLTEIIKRMVKKIEEAQTINV